MKPSSWRIVALLFLALWLPVNQVLAFHLPLCAKRAGTTGHMMAVMHEAPSAQMQGSEDCNPAQPCDDRDGGACMILVHCHFSGGWAFSAYGTQSKASLAPFVALSSLSVLPQFDPDGLERPPRIARI